MQRHPQQQHDSRQLRQEGAFALIGLASDHRSAPTVGVGHLLEENAVQSPVDDLPLAPTAGRLLAKDEKHADLLAEADLTVVRARLIARLVAIGVTPAPPPEEKEACFLHKGMLALAKSDLAVDTFEFAAQTMLPDGGHMMFATLMLKCVIADLERRGKDGADAPPVGLPISRKGKRGEQVVLCSTVGHKILLADCLQDAFTAFTNSTPEAIAARSVFKPVVSRPSRVLSRANMPIAQASTNTESRSDATASHAERLAALRG